MFMQPPYLDFAQSQKFVYQPAGLVCSAINIEPESKEYEACSFTINHQLISLRVSKITPTKIGQFLTFWKRLPSKIIAPFDVSDLVDFLIVSVRSWQYFGQFIFSNLYCFHKIFFQKTAWVANEPCACIHHGTKLIINKRPKHKCGNCIILLPLI